MMASQNLHHQTEINGYSDPASTIKSGVWTTTMSTGTDQVHYHMIHMRRYHLFDILKYDDYRS